MSQSPVAGDMINADETIRFTIEPLGENYYTGVFAPEDAWFSSEQQVIMVTVTRKVNDIDCELIAFEQEISSEQQFIEKMCIRDRRKTSREVKEITKRIRVLIDDMKETLSAADGAGLAAPQVGVLRRIVIVDAGEGQIPMINPVILEREGEARGQEGCLSCEGR